MTKQNVYMGCERLKASHTFRSAASAASRIKMELIFGGAIQR